jgi:hypothetical protein
VPLGPAYKAGLAGHLPAKVQMPNNGQNVKFQKTDLNLNLELSHLTLFLVHLNFGL